MFRVKDLLITVLPEGTPDEPQNFTTCGGFTCLDATKCGGIPKPSPCLCATLCAPQTTCVAPTAQCHLPTVCPAGTGCFFPTDQCLPPTVCPGGTGCHGGTICVCPIGCAD